MSHQVETRKTVLLSNGFGKFPLAAAAASLHARGVPIVLVMGAYPKGASRVLAGALARWVPAMGRFLDREEPVPAQAVRSVLVGELANQIGVRLSQKPRFRRLGRRLEGVAADLTARRTRQVIKSVPLLGFFHVRSGYGGRSLRAARRAGATVIVDHSIAHPRVLPYLVENGGHLPEKATTVAAPDHPVWRRVDTDILTADIVLVNSDFVAQTFACSGVDAANIRVIYQGVENDVIDATAGAFERTESSLPLRILYAGTVGRRKGALTLLESLNHPEWRDQWRLEIVGTWESEFEPMRARLDGRRAVTVTSQLGRLELARRMLDVDVFLFPSWAEGSARVIGMAMAAGCCAVVTPNSGSFLRDQQDGILIPPGDFDAVVRNLNQLDHDRVRMWRLGQQAAALVREDYRFSHYGRRLEDLYSQLS